jgi:hypothetical protein
LRPDSEEAPRQGRRTDPRIPRAAGSARSQPLPGPGRPAPTARLVRAAGLAQERRPAPTRRSAGTASCPCPAAAVLTRVPGSPAASARSIRAPRVPCRQRRATPTRTVSAGLLAASGGSSPPRSATASRNSRCANTGAQSSPRPERLHAGPQRPCSQSVDLPMAPPRADQHSAAGREGLPQAPRTVGIPGGFSHRSCTAAVQSGAGLCQVTGIVELEAPTARHGIDAPLPPARPDAGDVACGVLVKVHVCPVCAARPNEAVVRNLPLARKVRVPPGRGTPGGITGRVDAPTRVG